MAEIKTAQEQLDEIRNDFYTNPKWLLGNGFFKPRVGRWIDVIYTFNNSGGQKQICFPFVPEIVSSKDSFSKFLTASLSKEEFESLLKISTCIYANDQPFEEPEWIKQDEKWEGKFYFNDHLRG